MAVEPITAPEEAPAQAPEYLATALKFMTDWRKNAFKEPRNAWIRERERMAVHISGVFPEWLISTRRPREEKEIWTYRKANYEPTTQPIITTAIDGLNRIFNPQNFTIQLSDKLAEYLNEAEFNGYSFIDWFQFVFKSFMLEDANGIVVIVPYGAGLYDPNERIEPYIRCVSSCDVIAWGMEITGLKWLLVLKEEYKKEYCVVSYFDENYYAEIQVFNDRNKENIILLSYRHNLGYVPAKHAKGRWNVKMGMYQSFFCAFCPEANQSIREESDHIGSTTTCGHPYRVVDPVACTNSGCENGWLGGIRDDEHRCNICFGKGHVIDSSPFGVFSRGVDDNGEKSTNPIEFISPDTAILGFQAESIEKRRHRAKEAIQINDIDEAQSGTAKAIDREREYAMILMISNNLFDHIEFALITFERLIEINSPTAPIVVRPTAFGVKTESDLIAELSELKKADAPANLISEVIMEILKKRFPGDAAMFEFHKFLMEYDPYYTYSIEEKQLLLASAVITPLEFKRSVLAHAELAKLVRGKKVEIRQDNYEQITQALNAAIDERVAAQVIPDFQPIAIQTTVNQ